MIRKIFITGLLFAVAFSYASAQRIVVDTTSSNKYLLKKESADTSQSSELSSEEVSFGDRAMSIGFGILNRLKARFNLEEAAESLKEKKEKYLGTKEEDQGGGN